MKALVLLLAQQLGNLTGSVSDSRHQPVAAAKVHLQLTNGSDLQTAQTDSKGIYRFSAPPGTYTLRAEAAGFSQVASAPVSVQSEKVTTMDLVVKPQYFDEPQFTVAGITDNTYRGGHGSDTVLRSAESLTKATASLAHSSPADPHHAIAEKAERSGHPLEAVQEFQHAAELDPSEPNLFDWATELLAHRAPEAAVEVFVKGARLFPNSVRMLLGLASARYTSGSYEQAADDFFKAADIDPNNPNPYRFLNQLRRSEITQSPGYLQRLARFAQLQPENALANYYYGVALWNAHNDPEQARLLLQKAISIDPNLAPASLQLGIVAASQQQYPEAIRNYRRALKADPALEEAHYRLSEAYRLTGDRAKARQELDAYNQLSKQSAEKLERERRDVQQFVIALRTQ